MEEKVRENRGSLGVRYHQGWQGQGGKGARAITVERRSQEVLQALASVRDHKSKSTMRPRRLVASCAQVAAVRGAALWYAPREAAGPYRCCCGAGWGPAPTPIRLGPFGFPLTLLSPRLACTSPLWASAASLPGLPPPGKPGLGPVNDTVLPPPSVLQVLGKQDGGKQDGGKRAGRGKRNHRCSRDVSWARPVA